MTQKAEEKKQCVCTSTNCDLKATTRVPLSLSAMRITTGLAGKRICVSN